MAFIMQIMFPITKSTQKHCAASFWLGKTFATHILALWLHNLPTPTLDHHSSEVFHNKYRIGMSDTGQKKNVKMLYKLKDKAQK
jgi:hypothetical protein